MPLGSLSLYLYLRTISTPYVPLQPVKLLFEFKFKPKPTYTSLFSSPIKKERERSKEEEYPSRQPISLFLTFMHREETLQYSDCLIWMEGLV
jgi:hypothetical protein